MTTAGAISTHSIETRVHGRFLVRVPDAPPPWPLLIGFHGYAESAATHLDALSSVPGAASWLVVAIQALHPFYARSQRVVASWMTSEDREHAIADNLAYVGGVLDRVRSVHPTLLPLVVAGFSQGGAMAYRAAANYPTDGLIVLAADVPPDVAADPRLTRPVILIGRGSRDEWYTDDRLNADVATLTRLGARPEVCVFEGGHEWTDPFRAAASGLLQQLR